MSNGETQESRTEVRVEKQEVLVCVAALEDPCLKQILIVALIMITALTLALFLLERTSQISANFTP